MEEICVNHSSLHSRKNTANIINHKYFGPLIDSYLKCILQSGLLLDEDLEVLLSISKFRNFPEQTGYKPSLSLLASIISIVGSTYLARKLNMPLIIVPSILMSVKTSFMELNNEKLKKENKIVIVKLIEVVSKIQKLTANVVRYIKTRHSLGKTKEQDFFMLYSNNVEDFMDSFSQNCNKLCKFLTNQLRKFVTYSPELKEDFAILENLHANILGDTNFTDLDNCLAYTQRAYDINILVFSKLLSYLGIFFNTEIVTELEVKKMVNETIPKIIKTLEEHHDVTKKQFISLRHSSKKKSEIKSQRESNKPKNIYAKLESTLISSVNNLSVILEKSQNILNRMESGNEEKLREVGDAIVDLRNHTFATYESLDLLCRLYGILSNYQPTSHRTNVKEPSKADTVSSEKLPVINYDDTSEPLEEKYELYIDNDIPIEKHPTVEYEDHSNAYLSLMLQELKQSLKQHERFIQAKNKRGDEDDDEIEMSKMKSKYARRKSPPKFNLDVLKNDFEQDVLKSSSLLVDDNKQVEVPNLPAPLPPPLPSFNLADIEQETGQISARSMLDNIKVLSGQRDVQEEVFGGSDEDSDLISL